MVAGGGRGKESHHQPKEHNMYTSLGVRPSHAEEEGLASVHMLFVLKSTRQSSHSRT